MKYCNIKENTPIEKYFFHQTNKTQLQSGSPAGFKPSLGQASLATPPSSDKVSSGGISVPINLLSQAAQARTCGKAGAAHLVSSSGIQVESSYLGGC